MKQIMKTELRDPATVEVLVRYGITNLEIILIILTLKLRRSAMIINAPWSLVKR